MRSVMRAWKEADKGFGSILVEELDRLIVFDPPANAEQQERRRRAVAQFDAIKNQLRLLDRE